MPPGAIQFRSAGLFVPFGAALCRLGHVPDVWNVFASKAISGRIPRRAKREQIPLPVPIVQVGRYATFQRMLGGPEFGPTVFLRGERDRFFGGPEEGEAIAARNRNIRVTRLADSRHILWIDDPDRVVGEIERFVATQPAELPNQ